MHCGSGVDEVLPFRLSFWQLLICDPRHPLLNHQLSTDTGYTESQRFYLPVAAGKVIILIIITILKPVSQQTGS